MANNDKLWFELGVRDNMSTVLKDLVQQAAALGAALDEAKLNKNLITNAENLERVYDKIAVSLNRIKEARSNTKDTDEISRLKDMEKNINTMLKAFKKLENNDFAMGAKGTAAFKRLEQGFQLMVEQVARYTNEINTEAKVDERQKEAEARRVDDLKSKYYELYRIRKELQDAILYAAPGTDTSDAFSAMQSANARLGIVKRAMNNGGAIPSSVSGADYDEWLRNTRDKTRELTTATNDYNKTLNTQEGIMGNLKRMELDTASQQRIASIKKQTVEYNALEQKLKDIQSLMVNVNVDGYRYKNGMISEPVYNRDRVNAELEAIQRRYNETLAAGRQREKEMAEARNQSAISSRKAAEAIQMLSHVNSNLVQSYNRIAEAGSRAHGVTLQIQHQLAGYAGLYGIERILKSVITIGGQFEYQHKALQNILGDIQQANTLFGQLQDLAIESPKTFMELTSYTKQLAAYQIPANELFDTTKRLADLSSGLGVDMSRLILAFGQVRSAAVLRGQELRQFTEAGIPMVQALADEFSKLNGRAVTTGEVFELISKRAVPFEMVKKVMWDMTNEGGQFYNMQAELADTLYGKWQKLQDQWQITLGHIADADRLSGKFLKGMLEAVVALAASLDKVLPILAMIGVGKVFNGGKVLGDVMTSSDTKAMNTMLLAKNQEAIRLEKERLWYGAKLTEQERRLISERNKLVNSDYQLLAAENKISAKKAQQLLLDGKIERSHFYRLLQMQGYTREQRKQIANNLLLGAPGKNDKLLHGGQNGLEKMLSGGWSMIGGWWGLGFAAIGGIMSLYSNAMQKASDAADIGKGAANEMMSDLKEANSLYNELDKKSPKTSDEYNTAINKMIYSLKESGRYTDELRKKTENAELSDKYNILLGELEKVSEEYLRMKNNVEAYLEAANRVGEGNWFTKMFNDPMSEDIKQWGQAYVDARVAKRGLDRMGADIKQQLKNFYKEIGAWNEEEMKNLDWGSLFNMLKPKGQENFKNFLNARRTTDFDDEQYKAVKKYVSALEELRNKEAEVDSQINEYRDNIFVALEDRAKLFNINWDEKSSWTSDDRKKISNWINDIVNSYNLDAETAKRLRAKIIEGFPKKVGILIEGIRDDKKSDLSDWQVEIQKFFKDNKINIPISAQSSLKSIEKDLQNKRKELQEQMDRSGKILLRLGLDLSSLPGSFDDIKDKIPFWMRGLAGKAFTDYKEGQTGIQNVKKAETLGFNTNPKKDKGNGKKEDKWLKERREELKELENFYKVYKRNAEYMAKDDAIQKALDSGVFSDPKKMPQNIDDYLKVLQDFRKKVEAEIGKKPSTERKSFLTDLLTKIDEKEFEVNTKKAADAMLKQLDKALKEEGKKWDLYKRILDATGNKNQAATIAFGGSVAFDNQAQQLRDEIETATLGKGVSIDAMLGMNDEELEKIGIFKNSIDGVYQKLQLLSDVEQKLKAEDVDLFINAINNAKSLDTELEQIHLKYERTRKSINAQGGNKSLIDNANKNEARDISKARWEWFKNNNSEWGRVFGNLDKMSTKTLNNMKSMLESMAPALSNDVESTKALYEAIQKIDNVTNNRNPFGAMSDALNKYSRLNFYDKQAKTQGNLLANQELSNLLGVNVGSVVTRQQIKDGKKASGSEFDQGLTGLVNKFSAIQNAMTPVIDLFNALGNTDLANFFSMGSNALGAAAQMGGGAAALFGAAAGPWGAALGAGLSIMSSIFSMHDDALQAEIEASKQRQKEMENLSKNLETALDRALGGVYGIENTEQGQKAMADFNSKALDYQKKYSDYFDALNKIKNGSFSLSDIGKLKNGYIQSDTIKEIQKAQETGKYYDQQRASLKIQQDELRHQIDSEKDKKDTDWGAISDMEQQIKELEDQWMNFARDMMKTLYDIDVKDWASQFGDALYEAWKKGEDGAEAFKKKASEIIGTIAKNILVKKIIETALKPVEDAIIKMMDQTSGELNEKDFADKIGGVLVDSIGRIVPVVNASLDAVDNAMQEKGLNSLKENADSLSGNIKGITENTADLLASYLNAIRADVSVNRYTLKQILDAVQGNSRMPILAEAQLNELRTLVSLARQRTEFVSEIRDILHRVTPNGDAIRVS